MAHLARLHKARRVDHSRNVVAFERHFRAAGARSAVVGYDDEDRLLKPRVLFRIFQEAAYGIIRVLHAAAPRARSGRNVDLTFRINVWAMVARCHQMCVKRLPLRRILIEYAQRVVEQILITSAPDGAARYLFRPHRRLINDLVAVSAEEGPHIVEIAVAAVEKLRAVALLAQDRAHRVQACVVGLFDLALAGTRRLTQGDGLQSAHRTVAAGVEAFEEQTMLRQTIQVRRQMILIAKGRHIVGAQALHHYQHDIFALLRQRIFDFSRIQALHHILRLLR